jgi:hypothetical protein
MSVLKIGMYASQSRSANYLTFSSDAPFSIKFNQKGWNGVLQYSLDAQHWYEWDASEIYSSGNVLYLRGSRNNRITGSQAIGGQASYAMQITATDGVECGGNIMTLLDHVNPDSAVMGYAAFASLFSGQGKLITSPELPATVLAEQCYAHMLRGTGITAAPELPAMVLAPYCYHSIVRGTGIEVAPELPATVLATQCYYAMFFGCSNLKVAPELPATVLANSCYSYMLFGCSKIKISTAQTGIYQTPWRIPTTGTGTIATNWNTDMLASTGGAFKSNPTINTTYYQAT